jgi:hypothetical protein
MHWIHWITPTTKRLYLIGVHPMNLWPRYCFAFRLFSKNLCFTLSLGVFALDIVKAKTNLATDALDSLDYPHNKTALSYRRASHESVAKILLCFSPFF